MMMIINHDGGSSDSKKNSYGGDSNLPSKKSYTNQPTNQPTSSPQATNSIDTSMAGHPN